jgi:hypothetical protein
MLVATVLGLPARVAMHVCIVISKQLGSGRILLGLAIKENQLMNRINQSSR